MSAETPTPTPAKPGWKTTEFWTSLVAGGVAIFVTLRPQWAGAEGALNASAAQIIGGVFGLAVIVSSYSRSRGDAKMQ